MHWTDRIGHRLRPRDLHILLAVVERGNMAKAAEWLAISRPVVSKTIADLEQTLGVRLLDRSPQGLEPTLYGRALLKRSVAIFDELRQSVQEIKSLADPMSGELRIGCTEVMAAGFLHVVIERFLSQYPGTCVDLTLAETRTVQYRDIRERNIELMIGRLQSPFDEDDLIATPLFHEPLLVVAGKQSQWARRRNIELKELIGEQWALPSHDSAPGALSAEIFRACGLRPPRARVIQLYMHLTLKLVATGRFLAFCPGSMLHFSGKNLALKALPVRLPAQRSAVGVITLKNRTLSPTAERFLDLAQKTAKSLPKLAAPTAPPSRQEPATRV
jgi:DNA-binding transcriptional LysR family regulator